MSEYPTVDGDDRSPTITAFAKVTVAIAQLGGVVLGIGAVSYLIGHNYLSAYFGATEAPWALTYYASDQIAREGIGITSLVAIVLVLSLIGLMKGTSTSESLEKWARWLALVGCVPLFVAIAGHFVNLPAKALTILSLIAGVGFATSAGATLGELVARLRDSNSQWKGQHLTLILFIYTFAVTQAPWVSGRAKADSDMNPGESMLPYISKVGETPGQWRLVRPLGDKFLIVSLNKDASSRIFKLVSVGESWQITPSKP